LDYCDTSRALRTAPRTPSPFENNRTVRFRVWRIVFINAEKTR